MDANTQRKKQGWWSWLFGSGNKQSQATNKPNVSQHKECNLRINELEKLFEQEQDLQFNYIAQNVVNANYIPLSVHQNLIQEMNNTFNREKADLNYRIKQGIIFPLNPTQKRTKKTKKIIKK